MANGSPVPNWVFRAFDYLGLGCILISPAEFIVRPKIWQIWVGTLIAGCVFLWFGEKAPKLKVKLLARWRAPKALAIALAENASLKERMDKQIETGRPEQNSGTAKLILSDLFSPLQIEAFTIAKELRDFLASLPPFPNDPVQQPDEDDSEYAERLHGSEYSERQTEARREKQGLWRQKLLHGYANRQFANRITALMHRAGEEVEYPVINPNFAERVHPTEDGIRKLAQQMEMLAIGINRKVRNEVDLLHPKP